MNELKKQLLQDWQDFCQKNKAFDSCHFYTLFHADPLLAKEEVQDVFKYFQPHQNELSDKVWSIFEVRFHNKMTICQDEGLYKYALSDIKEKLKICQQYYEDQEELEAFLMEYDFPIKINSLNVEYTSDIEYIKQYLKDINQPGSELNIYANDAFSSLVDRNQYPCTYALNEAVYGLVMNHSLVWYVLSPLLKEAVNLDNYFYIWQSGSMYVLREDSILIYRPKR